MDDCQTWPHCPHLGMWHDRALYCAFPSGEHCCYRKDLPQAIDPDDQITCCLTNGWEACPRNQAAAAAIPEDSTKRPPRGLIYAAGLAVVVLAALALLVRAGGGSGSALDSGGPVGGVTTSVAGQSTGAAVATATPEPAFSPSPAAPPGGQPPTATTGPTATPTWPPGTRTYTVAPGDTLSSIATRFGTSVDSIMRANRLTDRNFIYSGQRLIIP